MKPKHNILVVDDEVKIRKLITCSLKDAGYSVVTAENGVEALQKLKDHNDINLVVLDILLPESSGLDVFETVSKQYPDMKVVISSVYPKENQEFLISQADDYYYKSDSLSVLVEKVRRLLSREEAIK